MDFERYNPDVHKELVPEFFSNVTREPENFGEFKDVTEQALKDIEEVLGIEAEFDVVIGEVDADKLGDVPEGLYFRGFSLGKGVHDYADRDIVFLGASKESDYWEAGLKNMFVHEEAHQEFYEFIRDMEHVVWESMIFEGHALVREEKVREDKNYKWRGDPREYEGSAQNVIEVLDKNRKWDGDKYNRDNTSSIFSVESDWEGIGYVIAQDVYSEILERNDMEIEEPLSKDREWLREQVEESIRDLYP